MSAHLEDFLKSGRKILDDTKTPALPKKKGEKVKTLGVEGPHETDPHKILIRRTIQEKPKKKELIEEFQKFITASEAMI
tara:strand:- start:407 stop:643 length:237 start_codon:yes stop_codon:yes gene_type:complete